MPARKKTAHDLKTREKIQTSQLVNRLMKQALGEVELSNMQMKAIEILLRKTLPDLSQVQSDVTMSGELGLKAIEVEFVESTNSDS